jgi:hypothetical protein
VIGDDLSAALRESIDRQGRALLGMVTTTAASIARPFTVDDLMRVWESIEPQMDPPRPRTIESLVTRFAKVGMIYVMPKDPESIKAVASRDWPSVNLIVVTALPLHPEMVEAAVKCYVRRIEAVR